MLIWNNSEVVAGVSVFIRANNDQCLEMDPRKGNRLSTNSGCRVLNGEQPHKLIYTHTVDNNCTAARTSEWMDGQDTTAYIQY